MADAALQRAVLLPCSVCLDLGTSTSARPGKGQQNVSSSACTFDR